MSLSSSRPWRPISARSAGSARCATSSIARGVSIVLNIAEGAGRRAPADKAHFFTIARGSASECAAILELLSARGLAVDSAHRHGRGLLIRIVQMLTRLIARQVIA